MQSTIEINSKFKYALGLLNDGNKSLFITGKAGVGKSTLLQYFADNTKKNFVMLAPTGVAALNIKGQTIHNFFNFYIDITPEKIRQGKIKPKKTNLYKLLEIIIIDEVSMLRADLLDCIDIFLRMYGSSSIKPFGGVQMVFVGDLYQLPPVVNAAEKEIFSSYYETPYFFSAKVFDEFSLEIVELDKVYRQKDERFVSLLNSIRNNSIKDPGIEQLNKRLKPNFKPDPGEFYISLTTTNKKADDMNEEQLQLLDGKLYTYSADITGDFGKEYFPTATNLRFKKGSQIMLLSNDQKKRWVNGTMGIIESIKEIDGEEVVNVLLPNSDRQVSISRYTWEVFRFSIKEDGIKSEAVGTFTQYPFRLAWAVTIHKSQGKTFDKVIIDIGGGTFAPGQIYVGLSRCTSFDGIVLKTPIQKHHIRTDLRILRFMTN